MSRIIWPARPGEPLVAAILILAGAMSVSGCDRETADLEVRNLRADERLFVERFMTLERARAVALADPTRGTSILDSLAAAWGDTSAQLAAESLSQDPKRTARLYNLLARLLAAEADSLVFAPHARRLAEPLPQPRDAGP